ncbi:phosphoglycerate mutase-like protein [Durotheca rogersii]|uniref:phosphoglycerate mutase-like protein n=1 Tax=Durotheca rogersii TaxID=419775 RepID=UPI00221FD996|nr:phosphoglycerate mutase-like protein [Durotheca rogersii]KAI5855572.1 phosphoglycerate mutase-like protein [Durotheca rogersii]
MSLEVIYVTRHGFRSPWSVEPSTGNYTATIRSPTGLPTDPALTSHGVEQANELASHLLRLDPPVEQVYSSPYYRCLQTIQPFVRSFRRSQTQSPGHVSEEAPFEIRADRGLSEWYGSAHFEHPSSAPVDELQCYFPEIDATYASNPAPSRYGESLPHLHDRVTKVIDTIIKHSDREGRKAVLVCTHAAVVIALGRVLTGQMDVDFRAFTCGLSRYRRRRLPSLGELIGPSGEEGLNSAAPTAQGGSQIGEAGSEVCPGADSTGAADRYPHDSGWPDIASPQRRRAAGLNGGWICELDSDCSFLRCGEERGWRFTGDESFIEVDDNDLRSSSVGPDSGTSVDRMKLGADDGHTSGTSKL